MIQKKRSSLLQTLLPSFLSSQKPPSRIACFMIFSQAVDTALPAKSLLEIVAWLPIIIQPTYELITPPPYHPAHIISIVKSLSAFSLLKAFALFKPGSLYSIRSQSSRFITMSKQRKTEIKDNNISSKLLGANLNDINIQKFRDISQLRKQKYDIGGKINVSMLKTLSNKFSPEVIFTVTLPGQAISSIEALSQCTNLMVLNLSKNSIENITPLRNLNKLRIIDLSENCIPNIEALANCAQLVNFNLEGNLLKGIDQLRALKTCSSLRNLHLQTLSGSSENPICSLNNYRANVTSELPQIKRLDCIPISMGEFSNGSEIKQSKKKEIKLDIKNIGPFYTNKFPSVPPFTAPTFTEEQSLKKSISSCKSALQDLEARMRAMLAM